MAEFASKGVAGTALGLGAGALGGQLLNGNMNGLLGNLFGNNNNVSEALLTAALLNGNKSDCDHGYNRYDAGKDAEIAELRTEVKLRDANTYTDQKILEVYGHIDRRLDGVNKQLCEQAVWNATQTGTITCMAQQIAALNGLTKLVIPGNSICPEMMPRYNSWTAPTTEAPATGT